MDWGILKRLRRRSKVEGKRPSRGEPKPEDLTAKTLRHGDVELPIINLNGLWALRKLMEQERDDVESLLLLLWVLRNQHRADLMRIISDGIDDAELTQLASAIDVGQLNDYLAALEEMMEGVGAGK
ncbi:MAG: hypothetical protein GY771_14100 [bacterium]|nr:hypothetical protein [bacterium]